MRQDSRGAIVKTEDQHVILLSRKDADLTTIIHELAHEFEDTLSEKEVAIVEKWSGAKQGTREYSEAFAKGAERYIREMKTSKETEPIFKRFRDWFRSLIVDATTYFKGTPELNDDVRSLYSEMLLVGTIQRSLIAGGIAANQIPNCKSTLPLIVQEDSYETPTMMPIQPCARNGARKSGSMVR